MDYEDSEAKATKLRQGGRKDFMKYLQRKLKGYEKDLKIFQQRYVEAVVLHNRALRDNSQEEIPRWERKLFRAANRKDAQILQLELFKYAYDVMEAEESYYLTHVEWEKAPTKLAITKERYFRGEATEQKLKSALEKCGSATDQRQSAYVSSTAKLQQFQQLKTQQQFDLRDIGIKFHDGLQSDMLRFHAW